MTNRVTRTEFAEIMGVTKGRVTAWDKKDRLVVDPLDDRLILANESKALVRKTTTRGFTNAANVKAKYLEDDDALLDPAALLNDTTASFQEIADKVAADKLHDKVIESPVSLNQPNATLLLNNARALNEKVKVLQATAEHEKYMGTLVQLSKVERVMFDRGRNFRDSLMGAAKRLSPQVVDLNDINAVENLLTTEFRSLLEQFAKLPIIEQ